MSTERRAETEQHKALLPAKETERREALLPAAEHARPFLVRILRAEANALERANLGTWSARKMEQLIDRTDARRDAEDERATTRRARGRRRAKPNGSTLPGLAAAVVCFGMLRERLTSLFWGVWLSLLDAWFTLIVTGMVATVTFFVVRAVVRWWRKDTVQPTAKRRGAEEPAVIETPSANGVKATENDTRIDDKSPLPMLAAIGVFVLVVFVGILQGGGWLLLVAWVGAVPALITYFVVRAAVGWWRKHKHMTDLSE